MAVLRCAASRGGTCSPVSPSSTTRRTPGSADAIVGYDAQGAAAFEPVPLQGRVAAGPYAVGGLAFVEAEPDGLVCVESTGKVRWRQPLPHGPIAGPVLATSNGDLLLIHQSGIVARVDATTGKELAQHVVGEPLGGAACLLGEHVFLAGTDGTVHKISLPAPANQANAGARSAAQ